MDLYQSKTITGVLQLFNQFRACLIYCYSLSNSQLLLLRIFR